MRLRSTLLIMTTLCGCAAAAAPADARAQTAAAAPGRVLEAVHEGPEGARPYRLYLPAGHDAATARPLLVMLHGCTQNPGDLARGTRADALAEEHGFLVLYPQQTAEHHPQKCWNWFLPAHQERGGGEPAILAGMIRAVAAEHGADPARIYLAGISAGGSMVSILGAAYPELFAGLAVHSALAYRAARDLGTALAAMREGGPDPDEQGRRVLKAMGERARALPVIVFHGREDPVVRAVNGEQTAAQWAAANVLADPSLGALSADTTRGEAGGRGYERVAYRATDGRTLLERWIVDGLAHAWSGGSAEGSWTDPLGPDAMREMVRFFLSR